MTQRHRRVRLDQHVQAAKTTSIGRLYRRSEWQDPGTTHFSLDACEHMSL